jgi:hypothetical protein
LLIGGASAVMIARPSSVQELLGNAVIISSVSLRSKVRLIRPRPD